LAREGFTYPTPNELYKRVRAIYLGCVMAALTLLFLAVVATVKKFGGGLLQGFLLFSGLTCLIFALLARAAARCPRCMASLMWKPAPLGMGRLSIGVKPSCPSCGLDLNVPWVPPEEPEGEKSKEEAPPAGSATG
jgi:hypothetical protein